MSGGEDRRCDVLHLVWSGEIGGAERHVEAVVRAFASRPGPVHRACFLAGSGDVAAGLASEGLAERLSFRKGLDASGLRELVRTLRRLHPGLVHVHSRTFAPQLAATAALPRARWVYTEHSPGALSFDPRYRRFYRVLGRRFARFVALGPAMERCLLGYGVPREKIVRIRHGLTVPVREDGGPAGDARGVIGIVARLERQKRIDLFVDTIAELHRRGIRCSGVVVGDGSEREELEARAASRGIPDLVRFAGRQESVVEWLDGFEVFLATSEVEPFGLSLLEAMARGVPVVAMPCPGELPDLVSRGGLLVSERTVGAAADAVAGLLASPERRVALRERGLEVAREHSLDETVDRLEALYAELLTRS